MPSFTLYVAGIALGLGLIGPIGPINLFLIRQGLVRGWREAVSSVALVSVSDTLMIALGAVAAVAAADKVEAIRFPMTAAGAIYLSWLAGTIARSTSPKVEVEGTVTRSFRQTAILCVGVVWLNPHALIDVFGVLGNAISVQPESDRLTFALGVVTASWIWYAALACGASVLRGRMTAATMIWFNRLSAVLIAIFAGYFWFHVITW